MSSNRQPKKGPLEWFNLIVNNALFFLESSIDNLEKSPRTAIIDLYSAIELFFKARLMKEHWSLILSKPEDGNLQKFENGDFHSVYLAQAEKRLKNICGEKFKDAALANFHALSRHRNQIVHWAHTDFTEKKAEILVEHWASWFFLHELLTDQWRIIFSDFQKRLEELNTRVLKNKEFLQVKFLEIKEKIEIAKKRKNTIVRCNSCEYEAGVVKKSHRWGDDYECLVCTVKDVLLKPILTVIPCAVCNEKFPYFNQRDGSICPHCLNENSFEYIFDEYLKIYKIDDPDLRFEEKREAVAYCHGCQKEEPTVIQIEGLWVCVNCKDRGWSALECNNCDSFVTGEAEQIENFACHLCVHQVLDETRKFCAELELEFEADENERNRLSAEIDQFMKEMDDDDKESDDLIDK